MPFVADLRPGTRDVPYAALDYVAHNGTISVDILYETPFTVIAPGAPEDLFRHGAVDAMVETLEFVNAIAVPA